MATGGGGGAGGADMCVGGHVYVSVCGGEVTDHKEEQSNKMTVSV